MTNLITIKRCYVYQHKRKDSGEIFYVGVGSGRNYYRAYECTRRNIHWQRVEAKHGRIVEIVFDNLTWKAACEKETELISLYGRKDCATGTLVNKTDGGEGARNPTPELRQKMAERLRGNKYNVGRTSPRKGKKLSAETKQLISKAQTGKRPSEATKAKMSASSTVRGKVNCQAKLVINLETGIFYDSATAAAMSINLSISTLSDRLCGRRKNKTSLSYC